MSLKVVTGEVRLSFPHLFEPFAMEEDEKPKYSVMILIPKKDKKTLKKIERAIEEATQKGIASTWGGKKPKVIATTLKDGDEATDSYDPDDYPERHGHMFMNVRSNTKPHVVDASVNPILDASEIYSGVYGRVSINAFPYKFGGKAGVSFGLNNVQKTQDGESLAGGSTAEEDFDALDDFDDEDDDLV